jgi:hypothetical protein
MESDGTPACEATVRGMLAAAGLSPSQDEIAALCAGYPAFRASVDALYDVAEARYADPALRFRAADTARVDWAS